MRVKIARPVPNVCPELQPVIGVVYDAIPCKDFFWEKRIRQGTRFVVLPAIGRFGLILRDGEFEIMEE